MLEILIASGTGMLFMCIGVQLYTSIKTANQIKELQKENQELKQAIGKLNQNIEAITQKVAKDLEKGEQAMDGRFNQATYALKRFQEEILERVKYLARKSSQDY